MTAVASGSTAAEPPVVGPRPLLLTIAAILLGVSAVLALLFPISQLSDKEFLGCSIAVGSANASPSASPSVTVTPSGGSPTVIAKATTTEQQRAQFDACRNGSGPISAATDTSSVSAGTLLLQGALPFVILAALGFFAYRGVPLVRWFVVGAWVIGGFIGIVPLGPLQAFSVVRSNYPVLPTILVVLGSITFTGAVVLVNLRPVTLYFNSRRPVRTAAGARGAGGGGLLGGLFGPRPARGAGTRPTAGGSTGTDSTGGSGVSMEKSDGPEWKPPSTGPAKTKSSGGSGNTGRAKGKKRG